MPGSSSRWKVGVRRAIFGALVMTVFVADSRSQPARVVSTFGRRYDGFRTLFADKLLSVGTPAQLRGADPAQWIVVVLGDVAPIDSVGIDLRAFVEAGGSVLIATDQGLGDRLGSFGLTVRDGPVTVPVGFDAYQ